jgi:CheY-like chemotaxis protein
MADPFTPPRPLNVLVVEDDPGGARALARAVRLLGHVVQVAHDGEEALRVAADWRPDAALVDIGLPKLNGWELAGWLARLPPARPLLVAVTGHGQPLDREMSRQAGFDHHLDKPIDVEALAGLLRAHADGLSAAPPAGG